MKIKIVNTNISDASTHWIDRDLGVRTNKGILGDKKLKNLVKITQTALAVVREFNYLIVAGYKSFILSKIRSHKIGTLNIKAEGQKDALVVFFHGLNGNPLVFNNHVSRLKKLSKQHPDFNVELFAPKVPKKGHTELDSQEMHELYQKIFDWTKENPGKPVVLFGQSNGTRVALNLEALLREKAPLSPVHVSMTAGVLYGTSLIQKVSKLIPPKLIKLFSLGLISPVVSRELSLASTSSKALLSKARAPLKEGVAERDYRKYASLIDTHVLEMGSSLPILNIDGEQKGKKERDYVVLGYSHNALVNSVTAEQVQKAFQWINKQNGKIEMATSWKSHFLKVKDKRPFLKKLWNSLQASFRSVYVSGKLIAPFIVSAFKNDKMISPKAHFQKDGGYHFDLSKMPWKTGVSRGIEPSTGLYLLVHGRGAFPIFWKDYIDQIKKHYTGAHYLAPHVPMKGNCPLKVSSEPFLEVVKEYIKDNPGKPMHLIGTSNGTRVISYIESELDASKMNGCELHFSSIAGLQGGSNRVNFLAKFGKLSHLIMKKEMMDELKWKGRFSTNLLSKINLKQNDWNKNGVVVSHRYFASLEDDKVKPVSSSLPLIPDAKTKAEHFILKGESHISIVSRVCKTVLKVT